MRQLLLFLLLLPLPLVSQVKILMPVVVKDASGKPVTDLRQSDFQVSGPKNISIDKMWLVPAQTVSEQDQRVPIFLVYDSIGMPSFTGGPHISPVSFLEVVAKSGLPVTVYFNTPDGLRLVYDAATPPEVLSNALRELGHPLSEISDPQVADQVKKLTLSAAASRTSVSGGYVNRMNVLISFAHLVQQSPGRKALVWIATAAPVRATQDPGYWTSDFNRAEKPLLPMYEAMVEELNAASVSVYPLFLSELNPISNGFASDQLRGLQQLSESTGGLTFQRTSLEAAIGSAQADFGPYYMLAVAVPTPKQLDWIPVKIKVNRPGLTVRAAPGFLGLKPEKAPKTQAAHP